MDIRRLIRGDEAVWSAFVDRFSPVIYSAVYKVFCAHRPDVNEFDIRDIVQSVFVRLIKEDYYLLKSYKPSKASLVTWLTIIARSTAIDFLRRSSPETVSLDEHDDIDVATVANTSSFAINIPAGLLSARQKLILHLVFDKEMDIKDISDLLKIDAQTVRSTKHKAIKKLRRFFKKNN